MTGYVLGAAVALGYLFTFAILAALLCVLAAVVTSREQPVDIGTDEEPLRHSPEFQAASRRAQDAQKIRRIDEEWQCVRLEVVYSLPSRERS